MKKTFFLALGFLLCSCELDGDRQNVELSNSEFNGANYNANANIQSQSVVSPVNDGKNTQNLKKPIKTKEKPYIDISAEIEDEFDNLITPANEFDRVALQMAALYAPDKFKKKKIFHDYANFINKEWSKLEAGSLSFIKDWSKENITSHIGDHGQIFYPFGGPDIAYVFRFFPSATNYVLVGLEPIGSFSEIKRNIDNLETVEPLKAALSSYLRGGFFITSEMSRQLSQRFLRGTLYMTMLQLAKLGFEIRNVEDLSIDKDGQEVARGKNMIDCVKISCVKRGETDVKNIYYVRMDLGNWNPHLDYLLNFVKKSPFTTFLKSASYALHDRSLSKFKQFILNNAQAVLQDDTGVPFGDFNKNWKKYVFGTYTGPTLPIFRGYKQQSMIDFYKTNEVVKIPFKIGYGYNQGRPNLLLAASTAKGIIEEIKTIKEAHKHTDDGCKSCNDKYIESEDLQPADDHPQNDENSENNKDIENSDTKTVNVAEKNEI